MIERPRPFAASYGVALCPLESSAITVVCAFPSLSVAFSPQLRTRVGELNKNIKKIKNEKNRNKNKK
jgi:hypothetical protein